MNPIETPVTLRINGEAVPLNATLDETLLTVLRDRLHLTATKRGCNQGVCGACTVRIDDRPMRACLSLALNCEGVDVRTLEGLERDPRLLALQRAFAEHGAFQCGFCTPGMLVSACSLLAQEPDPGEASVRNALAGNLCRCTGYVKIVAAVKDAAAVLRAEESRS